MKRSSALTYFLILCVLLPIIIFNLFPVIVMIFTSFKSLDDIFPRYPDLPRFLPNQWHWENALEVWKHVPLARYFLNSIIIATTATICNLCCTLPAAYACTRFQFHGRKIFLFVVLMTQMFSPIVIVMSLFRIIDNFGLLDTYRSLILCNTVFSMAFAIWLMTTYFRSIPKELEEAAYLDGCGHFGALWHVIIPLARPGIATAVIFTFIASWNEFLFALTFISSPDLKPLTVALYGFVGKYRVEWNYLMMAILFATLPVLTMFMAIEKNLVRGLSTGGIK